MEGFKRGDHLICLCRKKKLIDGQWKSFTHTKVRVTNMFCVTGMEKWYYNVYNITLEKYDVVSHLYLKLDIEYYREQKLNELLNN